MIALNLPETVLQVLDRMYDNHNPNRLQSQSFRNPGFPRIPTKKEKKKKRNNGNGNGNNNNNNNKMNFSSMKLFDRFRRIVMRFIIFSMPSSSSSAAVSGSPGQRRRSSCEMAAEPPKTSCSSSSCNYYYYSSNSHYSEAVADCIEFFNKSSSTSQHAGSGAAAK